MHGTFVASDTGIPVAEIVAALSFALDLTEDAVPGHALRSCLLGMRIAQALGLGDAERSDLFYAILLKDVGCSSNAARLCEIIAADERKLKAAIKFENWTQPTWSGVRTAWQHLEPGASPTKRAARLLHIGLLQGRINREIVTLRCDRGASIIARIGLSAATSLAVRHLDEHWDGSGFPHRLTGQQIPLLSRIILLAQHLDVFGTARGPEAAISSLLERTNHWFDPELVQIAVKLHGANLLWSGMEEHACREHVLALEPGQRLLASSAQMDGICYAFADVIDVKSTYTGFHSRGVADAAVTMAKVLGFSAERRRFIAQAALLHDLGKLRVPNSILDKPSSLTPAEFAIVREHPGYTHSILRRVERFSELALVAGQHHERLDGSGYPNGLTAESLSLDARLIAVADVYAAMAEDRPYRPGLPMPEICRIMEREIVARLDPVCYEALLAGADALAEHQAVPA